MKLQVGGIPRAKSKPKEEGNDNYVSKEMLNGRVILTPS